MRIINVMATALDGVIASHPGETESERRALGFINEHDHQHVEALLAGADAVILGSASLKPTGQAWEVRNHQGVLPIWVVLTRSGLPADLPFWKQQTPKW